MAEKVYHIVNGERVPKPGNKREPGRRYGSFVDVTTGEQGVVEYTPEEEAQRDAEEAKWEEERPAREAEAKEQQRKAEEYRASLQYEVRLVAFLDVLGWRAAIEKSQTDPDLVKVLGLGLAALHGQADMVKWMQEHGGDSGWPGDPQMTQFSDSIVISTSADLHGKFQLIMSLQQACTAMLMNGFLIRGGVTVGQMLHRGGLAYGPALTHAYDLESEVATHPRIILQNELSEAWGQGEKFLDKGGAVLGHARTWRKMPGDDWAFFDYLQPMNANTFQAPSARVVRANFEPVRKVIENGLTEHAGKREYEKYRWMAEYFNSVAAEYPDAGIKPIEVP